MISSIGCTLTVAYLMSYLRIFLLLVYQAIAPEGSHVDSLLAIVVCLGGFTLQLIFHPTACLGASTSLILQATKSSVSFAHFFSVFVFLK